MPILLLRWQLTRNQVRKSGGLGAAIAGVIALVAALIAAGSLSGGLAVGALLLKDATPQTIMSVWLGFTVVFLFVWVTGLLANMQRSESIDLQQLMHLPVPLGRIFVFNFLASHLTPSLAIAIPAIIGLASGLVVSRGATMLLVLPLALGTVFMVTAWTYCLRGWLAAMISNPRKRRSVIMMLGVSVMLLIPVTGLHIRNLRHMGMPAWDGSGTEAFQEHPILETLIPLLWLPAGAGALAKNDPWTAGMGTCGVVVIGALGLLRAYRSTLKFQRGETGGKAPAATGARHAQEYTTAVDSLRVQFLELRIPGLPEESCALALAGFRSMLRAPEAKIMFTMLVLLPMIFVGSQSTMNGPRMPDARQVLLIPSALMFIAVMLLPLVGNQFGFDRDGFRCLMLSPAERRWILLGKNLAFFPFVMFTSLLWVTVMSIWFSLPVCIALAGVFQSLSMAAILGICGNLLSIWFPFRIQSGSVKPTKRPGKVMLAVVLFQPVVPLVMAPLLLPALVEVLLRSSGTDTRPIHFLFSAVPAVVMGVVYWQTLKPLGRLLERREIGILSAVTAEVE